MARAPILTILTILILSLARQPIILLSMSTSKRILLARQPIQMKHMTIY